MDYEKLDPDHFTRLSAYTKSIHRDVYPAVLPTNPDLSMKGKIIIVTGAGSGIGATGIVPAFAAAGAAGIVLVGRRPDKLTEVASSIKTRYPTTEVLEVPTDITNPAEVKSLFDTVLSHLGQPADILINNAGVRLALMPLVDSDVDAWWGDLEINVKGTYLVTREFLKVLGSERPGVIINISSAATTVNRPGNCSYALSKLAISRMAEYVELENKNVICVALNPGTVKTEMVLGESNREVSKIEHH